MIASLRTGALQTTSLTVCALIAFASNSVLCRLALSEGAIDPTGFTSLRLVSGAIALWIIAAASSRVGLPKQRGTWASAAWLFLYAIAFSFAYVDLDAGIGALILFAAVQTTMIVGGMLSGERPRVVQWIGVTLAFAGLGYLVAPGLTAPSPVGSALMAVAGIAWGLYSLRGRGAINPMAVTAGNFARTVPMVVCTAAFFLASLSLSPRGILWAVLSGSLSSGVGYVIWYAALRGLSATQAATVQLAVPLLAAVGGVLLLSEDVSVRLVVSGVVIIGGLGLAVSTRERNIVMKGGR
jgi:drug/metabolite transporter (DMT)-like permease